MELLEGRLERTAPIGAMITEGGRKTKGFVKEGRAQKVVEKSQ